MQQVCPRIWRVDRKENASAFTCLFSNVARHMRFASIILLIVWRPKSYLQNYSGLKQKRHWMLLCRGDCKQGQRNMQCFFKKKNTYKSWHIPIPVVHCLLKHQRQPSPIHTHCVLFTWVLLTETNNTQSVRMNNIVTTHSLENVVFLSSELQHRFYFCLWFQNCIQQLSGHHTRTEKKG